VKDALAPHLELPSRSTRQDLVDQLPEQSGPLHRVMCLLASEADYRESVYEHSFDGAQEAYEAGYIFEMALLVVKE
jgi:hypothetical protein